MILTIDQKKEMPFPVKFDAISNYKEVDLTKRTVDLVANTYNYFDSDQDVLIKGCATKSIQERGPQSNAPGKIKHCMHHDLKNMIALPTLIEETVVDGNLVLRGNSYFPETDDSERELIKYHTGMYDQHSIGFRYLQIEFMEEGTDGWDKILKELINPEEAEKAGYLFAVKEIALYEYSTVAFGANSLTPYLGSKSDNKNIQFNNLVSKLDSLHAALRAGSAKDKYVVELQEQQIKQMIYELYHQEPSIKDTLKKPSEKGTFNVADYLKTIKIIN